MSKIENEPVENTIQEPIVKQKRPRSQGQIDSMKKAIEAKIALAQIRKEKITEIKQTYKKLPKENELEADDEPKAPVSKPKAVQNKQPKVVYQEEEASESDQEPEIVYVKKTKKQPVKQKKIVYEYESEEEVPKPKSVVYSKSNKRDTPYGNFVIV